MSLYSGIFLFILIEHVYLEIFQVNFEFEMKIKMLFMYLLINTICSSKLHDLKSVHR